MTAPAECTYDVFVSYSHKDAAWVTQTLLPRLEEGGLRVCVDYRDFAPGKPALLNMQDAAQNSRHTLLILTPAWVASQWTLFEGLLTRTDDPAGLRPHTVPLLLEPCQIPAFISILTYVDFTRPDRLDIAWTQLLTALGAPPPPKPPEQPRREEWCLAHPYPMPPNFTGRAAERAMLTGWLNGDGDHPLLVLRALGGFGKSALCWHWLRHDVDPSRWPRVVWWSFYEGDASFDSFLQTTLEYLLAATHLRGASQLPTGPRQQADELLRLLHRPGILLVLDGFERALRAYAGMNAAYQGDEPEPGATLHAPRNTLDDCLSPVAEHLLRGVASLPDIRSKVLLTTRLRPRALEVPGGVLLQGCREEELTHMQPADAVAFFRVQGIRGGRAEIEAACAPYGYHPLSLRLLAGLVAADPQQPGDIAAARRLDVAGGDREGRPYMVQRQHHVLEQAYASLTPARRHLLSRIACFRGPVGYEALAALATSPASALAASPPPALAASPPSALAASPPPAGGIEEGVLDADLRDLVARGLLHHDRQTHRYDLHPIVRRYAYDRISGGEREAAHRHLRDYFAALPPPEKAQTLDDLAPVIELYHHTVRAEQYDEACTLFRDRIDNPTYFQFGAYQLQIELLRALFLDGEDRPPRLKDESAQASTLNDLACVYSLSGQPRNAVHAFQLAVEFAEKQGNKKNLAIGLGNLAFMAQIPIGALRAAETNLRRSIALCREMADEFWEAVGHGELGRLLACRGAWGEAGEELAASTRYWEQTNDVQGLCIDEAYRALRGLLLARAQTLTSPPGPLSSPIGRGEGVAAPAAGGEVRAALAAAHRALELADETARTLYPHERDYVRAHWLLGAAHRVNGDLDAAERHLTEALTRCRSINLVEFEADILLDLARLRAAALTPSPLPPLRLRSPVPGSTCGATTGAQQVQAGQAAGEGQAAGGWGEGEALRLAQEALIITERSGYALQGADVHLFLAQRALDAGDRRAARGHAQAARQLATCDGPPDYTYKVAYDEAGALLAQLGEVES